MDLHYSQTRKFNQPLGFCFTTLWIYTILKHRQVVDNCRRGFTTLWIYTILKPFCVFYNAFYSFTTLWIYTILKPPQSHHTLKTGFTTLWIYTILKRTTFYRCAFCVLLPYGFTLFSNIVDPIFGLGYCFTTLWIYTILKPQISCAHYTAQGKSTRSSTIVLWRNGIVKGAQIPIQHIEFGAHIYAHRRLAL